MQADKDAELVARAIHKYLTLEPSLKYHADTMLNIIQRPTATDQEKSMALLTLWETLFPYIDKDGMLGASLDEFVDGDQGPKPINLD